MKIKAYVIDLEIPARVKRWGLCIGIPAVVLGGAGLAYAGSLPTFTSGEQLTATDLNTMSSAIAALQGQPIGDPPGTVVAFAGPAVPSGWLLCDGSAASRTTYANLFAAIGTTAGSGDGATTFSLPDYRGRFLRGVDNGAGRDPDTANRSAAAAGGNTGDLVGSVEAHATALPINGFSTTTAGAHTHTPAGGGYFLTDIPGNVNVPTGSNSWNQAAQTSSAGDHTHTIVGGDSETRPVNVYVNYIIKY